MEKPHKVKSLELGLVYRGLLELDSFGGEVRNCIIGMVQSRTDKIKAVIEEEFKNIDWNYLVYQAVVKETRDAISVRGHKIVSDYITGAIVSRKSLEQKYELLCKDIVELKREIAKLKGEDNHGPSNLDAGTAEAEDSDAGTSPETDSICSEDGCCR